MPPQDVEPETKTVTREVGSLVVLTRIHLVAAGVVLFVAALYLFSDVLLLLFAAVLLACQLRGAARAVQRHLHLPYPMALAIVVVALGGPLFAFTYFNGPRIAEELNGVLNQINDQVARLWDRLGDTAWFKNTMHRVNDFIGDREGILAGRAAGFVSRTIGNLGSLLLIAAATVYLAISPEIYRSGLIALMPKQWRPRAHATMIEVGHTLRRWFVGQLLDMAAIGIMTGIGLWLLGVPLFPTLALIAALANFVPYVGALAGSLPAIVVAFGQSPRTALAVAILFVVVQTIEGYLISPLISRKTVDLPPVMTLFAQAVLGSLFGPIGLILATPLTAALMVFVKMIYVEGVLGDVAERP